MALRAQVIDFIGAYIGKQAGKRGGIRKIGVVQKQSRARFVKVAVYMIHAVGVERRGPTLETVDFVILCQEQFGKVRSILAGKPGD